MQDTVRRPGQMRRIDQADVLLLLDVTLLAFTCGVYRRQNPAWGFPHRKHPVIWRDQRWQWKSPLFIDS